MEQTFRAVPLSEASTAALAEALSAGPTPGRAALGDAVARPGDDCNGARPWPLVSHHTPRTAGDPRPGTVSWTTVRHDILADGRVSDVHVLGSSGDAAFDEATLAATSATTFEAGRPLRGCLRTFRNLGPALPAPPIPSPTEDPLQRCPAAVADAFTAGPHLYPPAFAARAVEGWVLVRFDVASWGAIGAVQAIEAQPADAFRAEAEYMVRTGRVTPGFVGGVRCVVPVRFEMSTHGATAQPVQPPAPF